MGAKLSAPHPEGKTMKAIAFAKHGDPATILEKVDLPYPHGFDAAKNVVIKVHAASINPIDKMFISGGLKLMKPCASFPQTPCYDAAGVVETADTEGKFKVGDAVMVRLFGDREEDGGKAIYYRNSMSEYCVARTSNVVLKPENLSFEEAASIPLAGMTGYQAFKRAGLKEGQRVFITGGAGGVGTLAIQLAKKVYKAGHVAVTASAGAKEELCKSLGADAVVDYRSAKFEEVYGAEDAEKFDVVFDTTDESEKAAKIVKPGGKIVTIAGTPTLNAIRETGASGMILGLVLKKTHKTKQYKAAAAVKADWEYLFLQPSGQDLQALADSLKSGDIKPVLDNVWEFGDDEKAGWKGAFEMQFSGRAKGKCVVRMVGA